jgi:hypothetical protein
MPILRRILILFARRRAYAKPAAYAAWWELFGYCVAFEGTDGTMLYRW